MSRSTTAFISMERYLHESLLLYRSMPRSAFNREKHFFASRGTNGKNSSSNDETGNSPPACKKRDQVKNNASPSDSITWSASEVVNVDRSTLASKTFSASTSVSDLPGTGIEENFRAMQSGAPTRIAQPPNQEKGDSVIISSVGADVVGHRCWELPLSRRDTWTIISPDVSMLNVSYRNEKEYVTPYPHNYDEKGVLYGARLHAYPAEFNWSFSKAFRYGKEDLLLFLMPIAVFLVYPWK